MVISETLPSCTASDAGRLIRMLRALLRTVPALLCALKRSEPTVMRLKKAVRAEKRPSCVRIGDSV